MQSLDGREDARWRENRLGIVMMIAAMTCFILNDALVKYASQSMASAQLIFVRGLLAMGWILVVGRLAGAAIRPAHVAQPRVMARAAVDALATFAYLLALFRMPIGTATAIIMTAPLFITLFAVVFLRERVRLDRWLALFAGFAGVLLLVRPAGGAFDAFALLCLLGSLLHATRDVLTRRIASNVSSLSVTLSTGIAVVLLAGAGTVAQGWRSFGLGEFALLLGASLFLASGYYLMILSTRTGELSAVAPFRYSALLVALVVGWVVWGDLPDVLGWVGIAMLLAAGLYLLRVPGRR